MPQSVPHDFGFEFLQEQTRRLRKRVLWYCALTVALGVLSLAVFGFSFEDLPDEGPLVRRGLIALLLTATLVSTLPYVWGLWRVGRKQLTRAQMLEVVYRLLLISLLAGVVVGFVFALMREGTNKATLTFGVSVLNSLFLSHLIACILLPWTPRESVRPFYAPFAAGIGTFIALTLILGRLEWWMRGLTIIGFIAVCTAAFLPGLAIAWWKHNRFAREFLLSRLGRGYSELQRELTDAQRIHERLFPKPQRRHGLDFSYAYAPMRSIGGDYLYARFLPSDTRAARTWHGGDPASGRAGQAGGMHASASVGMAGSANGGDNEIAVGSAVGGARASVAGGLSGGVAARAATVGCVAVEREAAATTEDLLIVVLDVCGHGITAALTVNRLYGELERLVGEDPLINPTDVLRALNRFAYLTLSEESLFVTAIAMRIEPPADPADANAPATIYYANAGHPPACVMGAGALASAEPTMLEPTAMVLGVSRELEIDREAATARLPVGATLIAYTDGAMEARNAHGRMLNVGGVIDAARAAGTLEASQRCPAVMAAISSHRFGPISDDTLVVAVSRVC